MNSPTVFKPSRWNYLIAAILLGALLAASVPGFLRHPSWLHGGLIVAFVLFILYVVLEVYRTALILDDEGFTRQSLVGTWRVRWADVEKLDRMNMLGFSMIFFNLRRGAPQVPAFGYVGRVMFDHAHGFNTGGIHAEKLFNAMKTRWQRGKPDVV
ncbi:MAG: hypothetical protein ABIP97_02895 [Chthoniobacterales bacterium]